MSDITSVSFTSAPNPNPRRLAQDGSTTVEWQIAVTTQGNSPFSIYWFAESYAGVQTPVRSIQQDPSDPTKCTITVGPHGMANIVVKVRPGYAPPTSQSGMDVAHPIVFGTVFSYASHQGNDGIDREAPSDQWTIPTNELETNLSFDTLQNNHYGIAYDAKSQTLVLNYATLMTMPKTPADPNGNVFYHDTPTPTASASATGISINATYAYGPDGTLWHLQTQTWTHAAPYGVPSFDQMQHQEASLAWTPQPADGGSSGRAGGGDSDASASIVMCYVLDQAQFSVNPSGTTYYAFTAHEPKS